MTDTYATLHVSPAAYREIRGLLEQAGHADQLHGDVIDMTGIALQEHPGRCDRMLRGFWPGPDLAPEGTSTIVRCGATLARCSCGAKWCLDHPAGQQANPLLCPECGRRR